MQTANEMKSAVKNIRYYVDIIRLLNSRQFDLDIESNRLGEKMMADKLLSDTRIKLSGEIGSSCELILTGCQNIERQVQIAEEQDKKG